MASVGSEVGGKSSWFVVDVGEGREEGVEAKERVMGVAAVDPPVLSDAEGSERILESSDLWLMEKGGGEPRETVGVSDPSCR